MEDLLSAVEGLSISHGNRHWAKIAARRVSEIVERWKKTGWIILGR
ncbi:hypothetical protein [Ensifer adhaerens]